MLTRNSIISVGQGQGRQEIHPLVNSSILRNIFECLDFKSLKSVRETCSFWNDDASTFLQNKARVAILWHDETDRTTNPTLPTFMKYVESVTPENVFFRNYMLMDWVFHSKELQMTQFFLKCGQHIKNLSLRGNFNGFYEESAVRDVFYNWTPNMESLYVDQDVRFRDYPNYELMKNDNDSEKEDDEYDTNSDFIPMSKFKIKEDIQPNYNFQNFRLDPSFLTPIFPLPWKELFLAYPNLKTLSVDPLFRGADYDDDDEPIDRDNIQELLTALVEFQEEYPDKLQNLKQLDVFTQVYYQGELAIGERHFEQAMKLNFKLETVHIDDASKLSRSSLSSLTKYIIKLSSSLKTLKIDSDEIPVSLFPPSGKIITFPNLKHLSIKLNALSSNNVDFLQHTPKLETLVIKSFGCGIFDSVIQTGDLRFKLLFNTIALEPLSTLCHFEIAQDILTEDCVRKIAERFPNLSHFAAVMDDKLLWAVYRFLGNSVKILELKGKGITDAGITGISNNPEEQIILGPSIGQMKKLRRLAIDSASVLPNRAFVWLTDNAIHNGFILLTELTYLKISFGEDSITERAYRELCDRRNIMTLDTSRFCRGHEIKKSGWYQGRTFVKIEI